MRGGWFSDSRSGEAIKMEKISSGRAWDVRRAEDEASPRSELKRHVAWSDSAGLGQATQEGRGLGRRRAAGPDCEAANRLGFLVAHIVGPMLSPAASELSS